MFFSVVVSPIRLITFTLEERQREVIYFAGSKHMLFSIIPTMLLFYVLSCLLLEVQHQMHVAALIQIVVS
jgi:hypothetical protein